MKVTYEDHMGTDLSIVNAAKVSFGKRSEWEYTGIAQEGLSKKDQGLIQFLARGCTSGDWGDLVTTLCEAYSDDYMHTFEGVLNHIRRMPSHWSPFAHTAITLHLKMPIFVARQIMKHTTGIEYNEVSRRYVDSEPEFYVPEVWRKKADNVKQGSSEEAVDISYFDDYFVNYEGGFICDRPENGFYKMCEDYYKHLLACSVAPEQARMILPQSMFTEVIATGNLYAWSNLYIQRSDSHAQKETQEVAKQISGIIQPLFPVSWEALTK